jgi:hypothetical protein
MNNPLEFVTRLYAGYLEAWSAAMGWKQDALPAAEDSDHDAQQRWEAEGGA